jgi:hypothetical protein
MGRRDIGSEGTVESFAQAGKGFRVVWGLTASDEPPVYAVALRDIAPGWMVAGTPAQPLHASAPL